MAQTLANCSRAKGCGLVIHTMDFFFVFFECAHLGSLWKSDVHVSGAYFVSQIKWTWTRLPCRGPENNS